jgi:exonuclease III
MIGATWNVRGLNKRGKLQCITDFVVENKLDFVGFQETKKYNFDDAFLNQVHRDFIWHSLPTDGTSGGILVGLNNKKFEVIA